MSLTRDYDDDDDYFFTWQAFFHSMFHSSMISARSLIASSYTFSIKERRLICRNNTFQSNKDTLRRFLMAGSDIL
jgi:hypothetical protein